MWQWKGAGHELPARIPGSLELDLLSCGLIPPPETGLNARAGEWAALRTWILEKNFSIPQTERVFARAEGIQGQGMLCLDGEEVAAFSGGDWEIELTSWVQEKEEAKLSLCFSPSLPQGEPPFATLGVSGGVFLRGVNQMRICHVYALPKISNGYGILEVRSDVEAYVPGRYTFHLSVMYGNETLVNETAVEKLPAAKTRLTHHLIVPLPKRWELRKENKPYLFRVQAERSGFVCDQKILETGFREITFAAQPAMQPQLEGKRIFLQGTEWPAADALTIRRETILKRLDLLEEMGCSCLRVRGRQSDWFYEETDRRGILVWQILPTAEKEALEVLQQVHFHPSLLAYGCEAVYSGFNRPADSLHPVVRALEMMVSAEDGAHPFFGPVPSGPVAIPAREDLGCGKCVDVIGPDKYPGPEVLCRDQNADDALAKTVSCPAFAGNMEELAGNEELPWPPKGPLWRDRSRRFAPTEMKEWFGEVPKREDAATLSRFLQAQMLQYAAERARMRESSAVGFFVSGAMESVPSLYGPSLFDGNDTPRPAYFALKAAFSKLHVCAKLDAFAYYAGTNFEARMEVIGAEEAPGPLKVHAALLLPDGTALSEGIFSVENPELRQEAGILRAQMPEHPCTLTLRLRLLRLEEEIEKNDYTICVGLQALLWAAAHLPYASVRERDGEWVNECGITAVGVLGGGYGSLLPGEKRKKREEKIEGLNLEPIC